MTLVIKFLWLINLVKRLSPNGLRNGGLAGIVDVDGTPVPNYLTDCGVQLRRTVILREKKQVGMLRCVISHLRVMVVESTVDLSAPVR